MLAAGAFSPLKPDAIFAIHTAPYEVGQIGYPEATLMASRDRVSVEINGSRADAEAMQQIMIGLGKSERFASHPPGVYFVHAEVSAPTLDDEGPWRVQATFSVAAPIACERVRTKRCEGGLAAAREPKRKCRLQCSIMRPVRCSSLAYPIRRAVGWVCRIHRTMSLMKTPSSSARAP